MAIAFSLCAGKSACAASNLRRQLWNQMSGKILAAPIVLATAAIAVDTET